MPQLVLHRLKAAFIGLTIQDASIDGVRYLIANLVANSPMFCGFYEIGGHFQRRYPGKRLLNALFEGG